MNTHADQTPLLEVSGLSVQFASREGDVRAVDDISFNVYDNEVLGIVGESGSGKSVTALTLLQLLSRNGRITNGAIRFRDGDELVDITELEPDGPRMRSIRGAEIAMIFQEPMTAFSPLHTIGNQIGEAIALHSVPAGLGRSARKTFVRQQTIEVLASVGMPAPEQLIDAYPHELSGGMRQRAMIAMGLSCAPKILIADEPTTALDVTLQAQVIDLMSDMREEQGMSIVFITHDLGVIAEMADRVMVMYLGHEMETAPVDDLFHNPHHPYTRALLRSIPTASGPIEMLRPIEGTVPSPLDIPPGCRFHTRCDAAMPGVCDVSEPTLTEISPGHEVACFLHSPAPAPAEVNDD